MVNALREVSPSPGRNFRRWHPVPHLSLRDPGPGIEACRLPPVAREHLSQARRPRDHRSRHLHASTQIAQPPLRSALVCLTRIVGEAARDFEQAEPPRRRRDLLRTLVRLAIHDPRLGARSRGVADRVRGNSRGSRMYRAWGNDRNRGLSAPRRPQTAEAPGYEAMLLAKRTESGGPERSVPFLRHEP